jgi:hypothetical protein
LAAETDLMPNPVAGISERGADKSKKREGSWKPNNEPAPNRISEIAIGGFEVSRDVMCR